LKTYIRRDEPMSYEEIKKTIKKAIKNITKDNLYNYFKSSLIKRDKKDINITKFMRKSKIYKK
jgi:oligoribonuclease NrnB/cAMP/cGMP phosphodiesterase (DHH superfamily)